MIADLLQIALPDRSIYNELAYTRLYFYTVERTSEMKLKMNPQQSSHT